MNAKIFQYFLMISTAMSLFSCVAFSNMISPFSQTREFNRRQDIVDYNLEDKKEYEKYQHLLKVKEKEEDKEILRHLKEDAEIKKKRNQAPTTSKDSF